jgi:hypothetical protein
MNNDLELLCKMKFGSHLYGTNTEKSDTDFKGIYFPTLGSLVLQRAKNSINNITKKDTSTKNTSLDVDTEIYSLQYFIELAIKGETVALDMMHAPVGWEEITTDEWEFIKANRSRFYTKNLRAYIGYCRMQASKYGVKGSRLAAAKLMMEFLDDKINASKDNAYLKLSDYWDVLPKGEWIQKVEIADAEQPDKRAIEVCARKLMADTKLWYARECIQKFYDSYGERARQAERNEGIDWKAVSHAFRAGYQLKEIYETGDLKYPLKDAKYILEIKQGKYHYQNDNIAERLESLIAGIESLCNASKYPEKADRAFWDEWLVGLYK